MDVSLLYDIGIIVIICSIIGVLAKYLKQPIILAYILTGFLAGPTIFGLIKNQSLVSTLSEFGVAFLLFIIGLEIDLKSFKEIGLSAMIIGFFQVLLTSILGFILGFFLGFTNIESLMIGIIISFSSTMIVVKLLSEKNELDSLHGRVMLGILIMQDILAVFALSIITSLDKFSFFIFGSIIVKGLILIILCYIFAKYFLDKAIRFFESSSELLFVGSLAYCFLLSYIAFYLGYSFAVGAFIAGVILTTSKYNFEIASRTRPLRDFFVLLFFANLGLSIKISDFYSVVIPIIAILVLVLLIKPFIIYLIMVISNYSKRTSFLTSISLGQISEFSVILVSLAFTNNLIGQNIVIITIFLMIISITFSIYAIERDEKIYSKISKYLGNEKKFVKIENSKMFDELKDHIVVFGTHRLGMKIISFLHRSNKNFIVVDIQPMRLKKLSLNYNIKCIYGDMNSIDIYERLNFSSANMIISTVANFRANCLLIQKVKEEDSRALVIVSARSVKEALKLYSLGATYVIVPDSLGSEKIINYLTHLNNDGIKDWGKKHNDLLIEEEKNLLFDV